MYSLPRSSYINGYGILSGGGGNTPHRDHYERTIEMLLENGAPLDRIGMQAHFDKLLIGPADDILVFLDRCAKYRLSIRATER